jgi:CheY-like chemotaxis protein
MATILWIDDYAGQGYSKNGKRLGFDALIYFVELKGHQVKIVSTTDEIETALNSISSYDIIILDIIMQPLSNSKHTNHHLGGVDVLEVLSKSLIKKPIIIFSVMQPRKIREEAVRRGLDIKKIGVKTIERKGALTPTKLAELVEKHLPKSTL